MKQKKLMLLGGLCYLIPVINEAHKLGAYVITVDYVPDNIAHQYSDEYYNFSILDKEKILNLAKKLEIDGIMSFAVDPGVVTAAYVAEKMDLPFQGSLESIEILQDKGKFRKFLSDNAFNVPIARSYNKIEEGIRDKDIFNWPVIVKPVDSAGSKGVSKVEDHNNLLKAIEFAISESHNGSYIIEDFLEMEGHSSDSEGFSIDGELIFNSFSDQYFDHNADNPYTPAAYVWPSTMPAAKQEELTKELARMMKLLNLKTGIYNIETRLCKNGKTYIMECSPRGGGNRLAEMVDLWQNNNLIENAVRAALGEPLLPFNSSIPTDALGEVILHSKENGLFQRIYVDPSVRPLIEQEELRVKKGDHINNFTGANNAIGTLVLRANDATINKLIDNPDAWCEVITSNR